MRSPLWLLAAASVVAPAVAGLVVMIGRALGFDP